VPNNFIHGFPEVLDHFVDVVRFTSELDLLISKELFIFYLTLAQLFTAETDILFGIVKLFFVLSLEVFFHPNHFLEHEVKMPSFI
jgi:hypothetical protein